MRGSSIAVWLMMAGCQGDPTPAPAPRAPPSAPRPPPRRVAERCPEQAFDDHCVLSGLAREATRRNTMVQLTRITKAIRAEWKRQGPRLGDVTTPAGGRAAAAAFLLHQERADLLADYPPEFGSADEGLDRAATEFDLALPGLDDHQLMVREGFLSSITERDIARWVTSYRAGTPIVPR